MDVNKFLENNRNNYNRWKIWMLKPVSNYPSEISNGTLVGSTIIASNAIFEKHNPITDVIFILLLLYSLYIWLYIRYHYIIAEEERKHIKKFTQYIKEYLTFAESRTEYRAQASVFLLVSIGLSLSIFKDIVLCIGTEKTECTFTSNLIILATTIFAFRILKNINHKT